MFTGIIASCQPLHDSTDHSGIRRCVIALPEGWHLDIGESVNCNGVCSTVTTCTATDFTVEYMPETLRLTTWNNLQKTATINLERSVRMQDVLSGHLVSGHVDTMGRIVAIQPDGDAHLVTIQFPTEFALYLIPKGSVTVNGISLTVVQPTDNTFQVAIIPHTWERTNLSLLQVGDSVNLEFDQIAKYIAKQLPYVRTHANS